MTIKIKKKLNDNNWGILTANVHGEVIHDKHSISQLESYILTHIKLKSRRLLARP